MQEHEAQGEKLLHFIPKIQKKNSSKGVGSFSLRFTVLIDNILVVFRDLDSFVFDSLNLVLVDNF